MNSSAFSNVFLSPSPSRSNSLDFDALKIVPSDFWRRHLGELHFLTDICLLLPELQEDPRFRSLKAGVL